MSDPNVIYSEAVPPGRPCDRPDCEGRWTPVLRSRASDPLGWVPACAKPDCPMAVGKEPV